MLGLIEADPVGELELEALSDPLPLCETVAEPVADWDAVCVKDPDCVTLGVDVWLQSCTCAATLRHA